MPHVLMPVVLEDNTRLLALADRLRQRREECHAEVREHQQYLQRQQQLPPDIGGGKQAVLLIGDVGRRSRGQRLAMDLQQLLAVPDHTGDVDQCDDAHGPVGPGRQEGGAGGLQRLPVHARRRLHHSPVHQEAALPPEQPAPAPLRELHAAGRHVPVEGRALRARAGSARRPPADRRHGRIHPRPQQLGVQTHRQPVAVLHHGQLFLDPNGGPLPPQPHLLSTLQRQQRHHVVRLPRLGSSRLCGAAVGDRAAIPRRPLLLERTCSRRYLLRGSHPHYHHGVCQFCPVRQHCESAPHQDAGICSGAAAQHAIQALGALHDGAGAAVRDAVRAVPRLPGGRRPPRDPGDHLDRGGPDLRVVPGLSGGAALLPDDARGARGGAPALAVDAHLLGRPAERVVPAPGVAAAVRAVAVAAQQRPARLPPPQRLARPEREAQPDDKLKA
ncbi:uncharacterized protein LOC113218362 isoform X4 [Frankliniella occidentalis]|uniref:Uncharacterized protein LOC113218362 isoform X4 n=1 Tax=Frankliniella occidentalis TaxID=133901 RepID=A0A9C6XT49_FRAOC|nr:uncharacterized protein LOC113218362 isoform X4 [Frankliniella occidentalis]